jgi:hypothetical protein
MRRQIDKKVMRGWARKIGVEAAAERVIHEIKCSLSKADKLVSGRYPSLPSPSEQLALAKLVGVHRDKLFPLAATSREEKAS